MMRTTDSGRRGSALLIVLGMFSFMLVSAVAFSVYMRSSRAPSSYVRRNASARHLVKAALARAMDEIDTAIGNDPFPGIGYNHDYNAAGNRPNDKFPNGSYKRDIWHGHVFTPSSDYAVETNANSTVSTLTLEALGYLPPCLIDEVRYWSRHTSTARWRSFNYGLGQYAFTAVNVSDFFDLNQPRRPTCSGPPTPVTWIRTALTPRHSSPPWPAAADWVRRLHRWRCRSSRCWTSTSRSARKSLGKSLRHS